MIGPKYALRSMKAPGTAYVNHPELGTDPQPATMDKYQNLPNTHRAIWEECILTRESRILLFMLPLLIWEVMPGKKQDVSGMLS